MTFAAARVLPVPVAPSRTWWFRPLRTPSVRRSIAWGWSPVGSNGATKRKSGTLEVYQPRTYFERVFHPFGVRMAGTTGTTRPYLYRTPGRETGPRSASHSRRSCRAMEMEYRDNSRRGRIDRKSTRLNSSHLGISYA